MENSNLLTKKAFSDESKDSSANNDPFGKNGLIDDIDSFFLQSKPANKELDLDKLYKENDNAKIKMDSKAKDDLEGGKKPEETQEPSKMKKFLQIATFDHFKELFDISTDDVIQRLKSALFPFKPGSIFKGKQYDLYGPLWIILTLVFTTSIFGTVFIFGEQVDKSKATNMSINQIGKFFTLTFLYIFINPLIVYYYFNKEGARSVKYFELVSIYGYSFAVLPIVEVLLVLPIGLFKYTFLLAGVFVSAFLVRKELLEINKKSLPRKDVKYVRTYGIISHAAWILLFKLIFL